jgi:uncharacterized membrane protein
MIETAATVMLGVFAGSLALEGAVLVPFWRTLNPSQFFDLHRKFGQRLFRYFAPLTTVAVVLPVTSAVINRHDSRALLGWVAAGLALVVLSSYPLFFDKANKAFENRSVSDSDLPYALKRWAGVHAFRTLLALVAFVASALAA